MQTMVTRYSKPAAVIVSADWLYAHEQTLASAVGGSETPQAKAIRHHQGILYLGWNLMPPSKRMTSAFM
jgi:hypothetical protein